jgi:hypothetical protein
MGADFGQGYGYFLDGDFVSSSTDDWWWNNDWSNSDVLTFTGSYEAGFHHIEIYGFEDCCDGNFDLQWSLSSN